MGFLGALSGVRRAQSNLLVHFRIWVFWMLLVEHAPTCEWSSTELTCLLFSSFLMELTLQMMLSYPLLLNVCYVCECILA